MKTIFLTCLLLLLFVFSCKNEKTPKTKLDISRLEDQNYIDSLKKSVKSPADFEKLLEGLDIEDLNKLVNEQYTTKKDTFKTLKPYDDDLVGIMNKLRDTTEYGIEKIIELGTGEKVKLSEMDFGKHLNDSTTNKKKNTSKVDKSSEPINNRKVKKESIEKGIENLKKQYGLEEENMLVELLRDDSNNSVYNAERDKKTKLLLSNIQNTNTEETDILLQNHFKISDKELALLKELPNGSNIRTEKKALNMPNNGVPIKIANYLKKGKASESFKKIFNKYKYASRRSSRAFLSKSKQAKEKFKKLNPTWYSSKQAEETYMDSKSKYIYLPLGKLSFADKVISHKLGNPKGQYANGSIGEPYVAGLLLNAKIPNGAICNIGTNGVLTLQFTDNVLVDVNGPDLYIFEIGQVEPTKLEISKDGENWINIGKIDGGTAYVDIHDFIKPNESFSYVRLTDLETYSTVPGADVDAVATIGGALRLSLNSEVLFEVGKHQLKKEGIIAISKLATQIKTLQKGLITVEGHTDDTGSTTSNQTLSKKRAVSVANELKKLIKSSNFKWKEVGYGESRPIVKNDSDENRQINRRVEILVMPTMN